MPIDAPTFLQRHGPWALVTGASDGIGRACAEQLATRGMNLVLVARRREHLDALAAGLQARHGVACRVVAADLSELAAVQALADQTAALDIGLLVAAAGFGSSGPFVEDPLAEALAMTQLNATGLMALCRHIAPRLVARGRGGLVLFSSVVAFQGVPGSALYAATKAFVQTLAEGLHAELAPLGVDVLAVAPGPVHTGFAARAGLQMGLALTPDVVAAQTLRALGRQVTVRPGWLSKLLGWSLATAPRPLRVHIMGRVMAGMAARR
jgi:short-subunit dehydrogenase